MDTFIWIWALLGFYAFISVLSLQDKVSKLERRIRLLEDNESTPAPARADLSDKIAEYVGQSVVPEFYVDETDYDIDMALAYKKGRVTILDCDHKWVLMRVEDSKDGKNSYEKLLRINSIKSISGIIPNSSQQAEA